MSADFNMGDVGVALYATVTGRTAPVGSDLSEAVLTFTGPIGETFDREAEPVSASLVRYVTVAEDYEAGGFTAGAWSVEGSFTFDDGRTLRSLGCASFVVRA